ncbi:dihydroorotate dehydrogenase (quinone), mitochondrial [Diabrotica virgifera virgifera]|uniref:Dihydroorotate dehydrogenase (quinone), mitochondrial n=1 Tax=Diabrotica virgifera virgifera TaxID=50390 RepID=A0ABM5IWM8_DIAVI|nr:dihydroorotate dehydrogenase (quinone), mitochondrial [Diabrotica virgifera virgifera]
MRFTSARKLKSLITVALGGYISFSALTYYKNRNAFYRDMVMPLVHLLDPERAHNLAVFVSQYRLLPKSNYDDPSSLNVAIFQKEFTNPIGIAAGFDKDAKAVLGLKDIGFGFVEIGSVTPNPQPGNEKPRVFRLPEDSAVINRYGFNSEGHDTVLQRIQRIRSSKENVIIGVNLGKNKTSDDAVGDYVKGIEKFGPFCDYLVINISSPNTPGLRSMQNKDVLKALLSSTIAARNNLKMDSKPPLLLKLAPDLNTEEKKDIAEVLKQTACRVDGLIISNTTIDRPDYLLSTNKKETGGLSGKPLKEKSTEMIKEMKRLTNLPIIGVGGICTGADAYEKIKAGANLVQIYTSMVYEGPEIVSQIKKDLDKLITADGFNNITEAVGKSV